MESRLIKLQLKSFLYNNDFELFELPLGIKKQIEVYHQWYTILHYVNAKGHNSVLEIMFTQDQSIIQQIKTFFFQQISRDPIKNDIELLERLYVMGYTHNISLEELRALGLQQKLTYKTAILGKLKLTSFQSKENKDYSITPIAIGNAGKEYQKMRNAHKKKLRTALLEEQNILMN